MNYKIKLNKKREEIDTLLDFYTGFWKEEYNLDSVLGEEAYNNEEFIFFSIIVGDVFVGSGMFEKLSDEKFELRSIAIKKEFRGQGYGQILVGYMEEYAKKKNVKSIVTLSIDVAKGFYKQLGYTEVLPWTEKVTKILEFLEKGGNPTSPMQKLLNVRDK